MKYNILEINDAVNGKFLGKQTSYFIENLSIDSRHIIFEEQTLFIAINGLRKNGHDFIEDLKFKGVQNFIISDVNYAKDTDTYNYILVSDTLVALQLLATYHRSKFKIPVIGITGSNGKTIVKEWLTQLLNKDFTIVRSPKSYNSQIGVPLSVWQMNEDHNLAIFEAGISTIGEMKNLKKIISPDIGIFTYLGDAHSAGFENLNEKLEEKLLLFEDSQSLIYCADQAVVDQMVKAKFKGKRISWSFEDNGVVNFKKIINGTKVALTATFPNVRFEVEVPFQDTASVMNLCHVLVCAHEMGIPLEEIKDGIKNLTAVVMRLEIKEGINNCLLIDDTYNADFDSLNIALQFLQQQSQKPVHTLILSDLLQSGSSDAKLYAQVAHLLNKYKIQKLITIGENSAVLGKHIAESIAYRHFKSTKSFIQHFHSSDFNAEAILIKGARAFQFEKIVHALSRRSHRTVLEVNLSALLHNLNVYAAQLKPGVKIMAMVKASAYGAGSDEIAKLLQYHRVDYLCVAYTDEGVDLRKAGIILPIMVLNPDESTIELALNHKLEPEIYSLGILRSLVSQIPLGADSIGVHLKLDTGMNRLGFSEFDLEDLTDILKHNPQVIIKSIFTHLAASEDPNHDDYTFKQISKFEAMSSRIASVLHYKPLFHVLNSSGIGRFKDYQMNMVRLGIGLYGFDANELVVKLLRNVHTFKATISQIKNVSENETVGYGRKGVVVRNSKIATISVGYADGFSRQLGNGNYHVLINNKKAPTIGNVCMDMSMIDITDIQDVKEGDEVIIFGEQLPVTVMAKQLNTIPYEVFTGISPRVKRVYFQD
ncbi:MAG: bifunctional UDP-N-acetylmuramoyl-tripeptide:D-alanyl-D-alanine ligase/alanine racemase [Saprospiraceae bacterium]|nr:bifunctional UDP-N-acetylmuramoyl-tripeptide:D-alanyl-D-alanine ligase/alanine racemase [Saprospiraceae bacterium]